MEYRALGTTEMQISRVGMGTWGLDGGQVWKRQDRGTGIRAVHAALEAGINLVDTAPAYGKGYSERVVGEALRGRRDRAILATKFGLRWEGKQIRKDCTRESIRWEVEQSLGRLQTDYIDLYQCHWPDMKTPAEETAGVLADLIREGKIRVAGLSNVTLDQVETFSRHLAPASLQYGMSLLDQPVENQLASWSQAHKVAVLTYGALGGGVLTGKYNENIRPRDGRGRFYTHFREPGYKTALAVVDLLRDIAAERRVEIPQVAVAWVLAQPGVTCTLVGTRNTGQATQNAAAAELTLSSDELDRLGEASSTEGR